MSVGADLVSIHDMETNLYLMELSHGRPFYNGGHRSRAVNNAMGHITYGPWRWTDGSKFDWTNWGGTGDVEPKGIREDWFGLSLDGRWYSQEGRGRELSIICQFTPPTVPEGKFKN